MYDMMYSLASYSMICLFFYVPLILSHAPIFCILWTIQSLTSSSGGAVVLEAPTVGAKVDDEEATKLSAALSHEGLPCFHVRKLRRLLLNY